jgi:Sigma-70, region 4
VAGFHINTGIANMTDDKQSDGSPAPREEPPPSRPTMLRIVNTIFRTNCKDSDTIDATATWGIILEDLEPRDEVISILTLRYQPGMTLKEASRILGLPLHRVQHCCLKAMDKLHHPCRITRIRNSIMGWPNLYRDV